MIESDTIISFASSKKAKTWVKITDVENVIYNPRMTKLSSPVC
ncbi:hypothetical protein ABIC45_003369 [Mucilaginibacter rubeus]